MNNAKFNKVKMSAVASVEIDRAKKKNINKKYLYKAGSVGKTTTEAMEFAFRK